MLCCSLGLYQIRAPRAHVRAPNRSADRIRASDHRIAQTGRTHSCTRPTCTTAKKTLAKPGPSTHSHKQTLAFRHTGLAEAVDIGLKKCLIRYGCGFPHERNGDTGPTLQKLVQRLPDSGVDLATSALGCRGTNLVWLTPLRHGRCSAAPLSKCLL